MERLDAVMSPLGKDAWSNVEAEVNLGANPHELVQEDAGEQFTRLGPPSQIQRLVQVKSTFSNFGKGIRRSEM